MKNLIYLFSLFLLVFSLPACKKDTKPPATLSITGKWSVNNYKVTGFKNGVAAPPSTSIVDTSAYYQFNTDGTGIESDVLDPNYITPSAFNYHITGSNLFLSHAFFLLHETTCTISKPSANELVLQDSYTYQYLGDNYKVVEEVDLHN